ncbi:replication-relaxation family protein [Embleya sp. NPDC020630]|uniref:replication-relaxation family protein n=1 Tax=Embleya sp. NPDC020630 TaxID=3363979 RepID=UPI0037B5D7AF
MSARPLDLCPWDRGEPGRTDAGQGVRVQGVGRAREGPARWEVDRGIRGRSVAGAGAVDAKRGRVADTAQLRLALTPHLASPAYVRRVVMQLLDADLVGRVPRGRTWVWHLTQTGRRALVEAGAPERRRAATGEAALRSGLAAHALTVTATAIEFARHGWGGITDWAVEVAHPIEGGRVTTDAVLTLEHRCCGWRSTGSPCRNGAW